MTLRAKGVCAIPAQKNAHVHFVSPRLHPVKKPLDPVPSTALPHRICGQIWTKIAVDDPFLVSLWQIFISTMNIDLSIQRSGNQIVLTLTHLAGLKWLDHAIRNAQLPIRHRAVKINSDRASKTAATWTGTKRIVE